MAEYGQEASLLAGGTDLLVGIRNGKRKPSHLVNLNNLEELREIRPLPDGGLRIGALATLRRIAFHPQVREQYQALAESCQMVGSVQIQNTGTLAGNICNASPAADTAPSLLVLDARVNVVGLQSRRTIPVSDFILGPAQTALRSDEVVESVDLPPGQKSASCYLKLGRTRGVDLAIVGVAVQVSGRLAPGVAFASVAPTPLRVREAEAELAVNPFDEARIEAATRAVIGAIHPISDLRASAEYRTAMACVLLRRALEIVRKR